MEALLKHNTTEADKIGIAAMGQINKK